MGVVTGTKLPAFFRSPQWISLLSIFMVLTQALLALPTDSFFGVFENNSLRRQFPPNLIGAREIAGFLGRIALRNQGVDSRIVQPACAPRRPEHVEYGIEPIE